MLSVLLGDVNQVDSVKILNSVNEVDSHKAPARARTKAKPKNVSRLEFSRA